MAPQTPIGRMTLRRNAPGDGQKPKIRLWTLGTPAEGTTADKLLKHYQRVFVNIGALDAKKAELARSQDLTDIGRQSRKSQPSAASCKYPRPTLPTWPPHFAGRKSGGSCAQWTIRRVTPF